MTMNNLNDVMMDLLKDLYHAEKQLVAALPKMASATDSDDLRKSFESHLEETNDHVDRLEKVFTLLEMKPLSKMCHGMKGLIEEGKEVIEQKKDGHPAAIDAALIAAAQKVEHYEISAYGTLVAHATALGLKDIAEIFSATLSEEVATDEKLSELAESSINSIAAAAEREQDEQRSTNKKNKPPVRPKR